MNTLDLGTGPTLLFLHGVGMRAAAYRPLINTLAKHFRVIAPDLPGAGWNSLPPEEPTLEGFAADVQALLDARKVRPDVIVGHSLGGGVPLSLAAARGFPRRLVLIDSVGAGSHQSTPSLLARFLLLKNLRLLFSPARWPAVWRVLPHFLATTAFRFRKCLRLGRLALGAAHNLHPALAIPGASPVFVSATDDELFPPALYHDCAAAHPGSRVVEVSGGHDWCLLNPEAAAAVVMRIAFAKSECDLILPPP